MSGSSVAMSPPLMPAKQPGAASRHHLPARAIEGNAHLNEGEEVSQQQALTHVYLHGPTYNLERPSASSLNKNSAAREAPSMASGLSSSAPTEGERAAPTQRRKPVFHNNRSQLGLYDPGYSAFQSDDSSVTKHYGLDSAGSSHSFSNVPYLASGISYHAIASGSANASCRSQLDSVPRYNSLPSPSSGQATFASSFGQSGEDEVIAALSDFDFQQQFPPHYQQQQQRQQSSPTSSGGPYFRSSLETSSFSSTTQDSYNAIPLARRKRNKCSPEQYRQLEAFFAKNRNPTGKVREELSRRIQMPERSVQVWFQNKRAKTKSSRPKDDDINGQRTSKNSIETTERRASHPREGQARVGAMQTLQGREESQQSTILQLPCLTLCIGEWRRIKPLICLFSRRNQSFTWYISSESVGFKLECPLSNVTKITFSGPTDPTIHELNEGLSTSLGCLSVHLARPPQFYMEVFRSSGKSLDSSTGGQRASWRQCTDFTEGKQATVELEHRVGGPYNLLRQALMDLQGTNEAIAKIVEFQDQGRMEQIQIKQYQYWTAQHDRLMLGQPQNAEKMTMQSQSEPQSQMPSPSQHQSMTGIEGYGIDMHPMSLVSPGYAAFPYGNAGEGSSMYQHTYQHQHHHHQNHTFPAGPLFPASPQHWSAGSDADTQHVSDLYLPLHSAGLELSDVPLQPPENVQGSDSGLPSDPRLSPAQVVNAFQSWPCGISEEEDTEGPNDHQKESNTQQSQTNLLGAFPRSSFGG